MRSLPFGLLLAGCGARSNRVEGCAPGDVFADPDGRGNRCIRADSECFSAGGCGEPESACCSVACADSDADRRWTCEGHCTLPDCQSPADCGPGERCEPYAECRAECVPDMPCPAGQVMADPDGQGFRCIPASSSCFQPTDCEPSLDPCCTASCLPDLAGVFSCQEDCGGNTLDERDMAAICYDDADCAYLGAGAVCAGCPGTCVTNDCFYDADCTLATDVRECCACPAAYSLSWAYIEPCVVAPGEGAAPAGCLPDACDMALCVECPSISAACVDGACVAINTGGV